MKFSREKKDLISNLTKKLIKIIKAVDRVEGRLAARTRCVVWSLRGGRGSVTIK